MRAKMKILSVILTLFFVLPVPAQKLCFSRQTRKAAETHARVWHEPDPGYDPVLGYDPATGPRKGAPAVNDDGLALPIKCTAIDHDKGAGTTPKFYCTVDGVTDENGKPVVYKVKPHFKGQQREMRNGEIYGEFLSSRFSQALGFFADDEWVADVLCRDCKESLTKGFQGVPFGPFQPAAGVELGLGKGIDTDCDDKDTAPLDRTLSNLLLNGASEAEIDAFKLWLAFIDHDDTKADNQKFACLDPVKSAGVLSCDPQNIVYYVSDMGSTFGSSSLSEKKATLALWKGKDPIRMEGGRCHTTAKGIGDTDILESGRVLLAEQLQRLLDAEAKNGLITRVFKASRNEERDRPAAEWAAEFIRKAKTVINARCDSAERINGRQKATQD
jgi:hypothetical protein